MFRYCNELTATTSETGHPWKAAYATKVKTEVPASGQVLLREAPFALAWKKCNATIYFHKVMTYDLSTLGCRQLPVGIVKA